MLLLINLTDCEAVCIKSMICFKSGEEILENMEHSKEVLIRVWKTYMYAEICCHKLLYHPQFTSPTGYSHCKGII